MKVISKKTGSSCRMLLLCLLSFVWCGSCAAADSHIEEKETAEKELKQLRCIAFYSSVNGVSSTISRVTSGIQEQLEEGGDVSLSVYCLQSDLYESMEYKVKTAAALDMDVMIVSNMSDGIGEEILKELQEHEIFVLTVDGQPSAYELSACIGADNLSAGVQAAQLIARMEGKHCAGILATSFRDGHISVSRQERQAGFEQEAQIRDNLETLPLCICISERLEAMQTIRTYLEEYPQMDVLYCLDSASGVLASKILKEQNREEEVYVICFDQTDQVEREMQQGGINAVIEQEAEIIGQECAEFLRRMAQSTDVRELSHEETAVPCRIITSEEMGERVRE